MIIIKKKQPWEESEEKGCIFLGMKHVGGSGKPDCIKEDNPDVIAEIKDYRRDFNTYDLKLVLNKKWSQGKDLHVGVINGCTVNVIKFANGNPKIKLICDLGEKFENEKPIKTHRFYGPIKDNQTKTGKLTSF